MEMLLGTDENLGYVLINYAILGEPSVEATRIALAFSGQHGHDKYRDFHIAMFARRGIRNGQRALDVAVDLGADPEELVAFADSEAVTQAMKRAISIGNALGLHATPAYLVGPWAYDGHMEIDRKLRIIDDLRS
jgi:protein-disulfide isomerase